jgi:hypothetical protein
MVTTFWCHVSGTARATRTLPLPLPLPAAARARRRAGSSAAASTWGPPVASHETLQLAACLSHQWRPAASSSVEVPSTRTRPHGVACAAKKP